MNIDRAIEIIEGYIGIRGIWHQWDIDAIKTLYIYVCTAEHGKPTIQDSKNVGIDLSF